ncbi:MAG: hypothetical protein NZ811_02660 [Gammaproteobacteria bacterium]|nr:hypothetical protein [Gammaproteobacteria bacterium]
MHTLYRNWLKYLREDIQVKIEVPFSFEPHEKLNKDFWNQPGDKLDPTIRAKLLEIAMDFVKNSQAADAPLKDITFTGSLANFNYSDFSDVDLHVLYDFGDINKDEDLVRDYFQATKSVWNNAHDINMLGYEVEIYGQDVKDPHTASGLYSVLNDEWIVKPDRADPQIDHKDIQVKANDIEKQIDEVVDLYEDGKFEEAIKQADRLKEKIRRFRTAGLQTVGEYSVENLAFKTLRRNGYLGILSNAKTNAYDKMMSIED